MNAHAGRSAARPHKTSSLREGSKLKNGESMGKGFRTFLKRKIKNNYSLNIKATHSKKSYTFQGGFYFMEKEFSTHRAEPRAARSFHKKMRKEFLTHDIIFLIIFGKFLSPQITGITKRGSFPILQKKTECSKIYSLIFGKFLRFPK